MNKHEYAVIDSNGEEISLVACYMNIDDGYTCFYGNEYELLHAFYHPKRALRMEGHKDEDI